MRGGWSPGSDPVPVRLFVYGSLKRGLVHHDQLAAAVFESEAETAPGYALYVVGDYPALVLDGGAGHVQGEVYQVGEELLAALDVFEDCPRLYQRVCVRLADGREALAYFMPGERVAGCPRLGGCRWPAEMRERRTQSG
jgi:gamma-glutamylcyclotransferase (GGCT)/AIG2-like uncharacterized protein YtfP